jgi:hypothetical protein
MLVLLMGGICELGSSAMIYIPIFIKNGSGIQKFLWGIHIQTHRQQMRKLGLKLEYSERVGQLFIDLKKAYDSVRRKVF